jgi:phosphopantetheinyl transferase
MDSYFLSLHHISEFESSVHIFQSEYIKKFVDENRKKESIVARVALDRLCKNYFGKGLTELGFYSDALGRPLFEAHGVWCSISHSHGWVLAGISSDPFGLDIEKIDEENGQQLELAFSSSEWMQIRGDSKKIFFAFSKKESMSKFFGHGFHINPDELKADSGQFEWKGSMKSQQAAEFVITLFGAVNKKVEFYYFSKMGKFQNESTIY